MNVVPFSVELDRFSDHHEFCPPIDIFKCYDLSINWMIAKGQWVNPISTSTGGACESGILKTS